MNIFRINEYEWYMAETAESAIQAAMADTGLPRDEAIDEYYFQQLAPYQLDRLKFTDEDGTKRTFKEGLQRQIEKKGRTASLFASTLE